MKQQVTVGGISALLGAASAGLLGWQQTNEVGDALERCQDNIQEIALSVSGMMKEKPE